MASDLDSVARPREIIPARGQVSGDALEASNKQSCDVLHEHESRSKCANGADELTPALPRLAPRIDASGCSSWLPPTAVDYGTRNNGCPGDGRAEYATKGSPSLSTMARLPTPLASDGRAKGSSSGNGPSMDRLGRMLPTPLAPDWKGATNDRRNSPTLSDLLPTATATDAKGSRRATARTEASTSNPGTTLTDAAQAPDKYQPAIER